MTLAQRLSGEITDIESVEVVCKTCGTSIAFILGVLPLVFASGAGSAGRHSVGTTVFGGMIVSTLLNLVIIPVLYIEVRSLLPMKFKPQPVAEGPELVEKEAEDPQRVS